MLAILTKERRDMYKLMPTRPHVLQNTMIMQLVALGTCWHFDAWMMREPGSGDYYLHVQTRAGGRSLLTEHTYLIIGTGLKYITAIPAKAEPVTMHDKALWPEFDRLNAMHWRSLFPMALRVPAGYRSRSVAFHYVRAPSLDPFSDDALNMSQYA